MKIGKLIKQLREDRHISQQELAEYAGMPRTALVEVESGRRRICAEELKAFSLFFQVSADYLLGDADDIEVTVQTGKKKNEKQDIRISVPAIKAGKFKQVLLYILERCAGKPNVGMTVIYKLLYFADFNFYELYEEQMTGATYRKQQYGPVPLEFTAIMKGMEKAGEIKEFEDRYYEYPQKRYVPLVKADLNSLKASEKDVLDKVIAQLSDKSASEISAYSHEDMPWKATADRDVIDYELVFYRVMPYSARNYGENGGK